MDEQRRHPEQNLQTVPTQRVLRLTDLVYVLRKRLPVIVICAAVGLVIGVALSLVSCLRGEISREYAITSSIAVTSQDKNGLFIAQSNNPDSADIYLAEKMVDAVIYVLKSDQMLNAAIDRLELLDVRTRDISRNLNLNQYNETQIIEMTLYWRSANEGEEILKAINAVAPDILVKTLKIGSVSVINQPAAHYRVGGSLNATQWIYMVLMGAMLGVGFGVVELLLRPTLLKAEDMERLCHLEVLGKIPNRSGYFRKKRNLLLTSEDDQQVPEILDNYVSLAHILKARLSKKEHPCVCITSAARSEGKTTIAAYLAVQLAAMGLKVLVVDLDTRNPRLGGLFLSKVDDAHSINALYRGDTPAEEAITHLTANLDILPAVLERKPLPYDERLLNIISRLQQNYHIVLMDTAPVGLAADTMSLNRLADGAVLVVRFDGASMEIIQQAIARLEKSNTAILGCVVNCVKNSAGATAIDRDGDHSGGHQASGTVRMKTDREQCP